MQIQVNTDNHIKGTDKLTALVEDLVTSALDRFSDRITRLEVHLTDENSSQKKVGDDKRCKLEARLAGMQPVTVSADGSNLEAAIIAASEKMETLLTRTLDKLDDPKGRTSYAGDQSS